MNTPPPQKKTQLAYDYDFLNKQMLNFSVKIYRQLNLTIMEKNIKSKCINPL